MNALDYVGGEYLKPADIPAEGCTGVITDIYEVEFEEEKGKRRTRLCTDLEGVKKPFVLNSGSTMFLIGQFGQETDNWKGARLFLSPSKIIVRGKMTDTIVIKSASK